MSEEHHKYKFSMYSPRYAKEYDRIFKRKKRTAWRVKRGGKNGNKSKKENS